MNTQNLNSHDDAKLHARVDELTKELEKVKSVLCLGKEVMTLEEASIFTGLSRSTLYKMTHKNVIPYYKPAGKLVYFERCELLGWMRSHAVASEAQIEKMAEERLQQLAIKD